MANRVELVFDFVSPNAYMVWWPLRDLMREHGAELDVVPVFLGGMHRITGNAPPMIRDADVRGKVEYAAVEMRRFIERHQLTKYRLHPKFPFNSITLQRMLYAADQDGRGVQFVEAMLPAVWERSVDITDSETLLCAVRDAGFDAADLAARAQTDEVKEGLVANTTRAVERGAFGIPTMFVGSKGKGEDDGSYEMFFGKERLGQIAEELVSG
jgi:2-hydroxychromene-2-carboxylate isomerase